MGGPGSGSWYRWNRRPVVEDSLTLDIGRMLRLGLVLPGCHVSNVLHWTRESDGSRVASIRYEANLLDRNNGWVRLQYNHNDSPKGYVIALSTTDPNFGGLRWWFLCPLTGDRVAKLHLPSGGSIFGSRKAYGLAYRSQRHDASDRMAEKAHRLRERLGGRPGFAEPMPSKPKGMHWRTYERIVHCIAELEHRSMMAMALKLSIRCC